MAGISSKAIKPKYCQNNFKYNGKELQTHEFEDASGLEVYDFGARFQDPQISIWHNADPLSEKMGFASNCNYAFDNPTVPAVRYTKGFNYVDPKQLFNGIFSNLINYKLNQQYGRPSEPPTKGAQ